MLVAHIIGVRRGREPEIRELTVPAETADARVASMRRMYDTVFIHRTFTRRDA